MNAIPVAPPPQGSPARVLVAEDDFELRRMMVRALRKDGYEIVEATDGIELLERVADTYYDDKDGRPYDVIVTDIRMPGWSGMQVLHGFRGRAEATPVILVTAFGDEQTHRLAEKLGAVCVLDKPFDMDDLRMIVLNTVKRQYAASAAISAHVH
jgi:DNA-binding response OmpR family regulator